MLSLLSHRSETLVLNPKPYIIKPTSQTPDSGPRCVPPSLSPKLRSDYSMICQGLGFRSLGFRFTLNLVLVIQVSILSASRT